MKTQNILSKKEGKDVIAKALKGSPRDSIDNGNYILTESEYEALCDNFYQAQSIVKLLNDRSKFDLKKTEDGFNSCDVLNITDVLLERFKNIETLLGK